MTAARKGRAHSPPPVRSSEQDLIKFVTALDMAVCNYPGGCEPRWRVHTDWNATMAGSSPAMVVADTTSV